MKGEKLVEEISNLKARKSKTYILPLLYKYVKLPVHNIINSFLIHEDYPDNVNHIYIVFQWSPSITDTKLEDDMINNEYCEFHVDLNNKYYMICFRIPDEIIGEYDKFLRGKYSKLKDESKKAITSYYRLKDEHVVCKILRKDPSYKKELEDSLGVKIGYDNELSSIIDIDEETFKKSLIPVNKSPLKPMRKY